MNEFFKKVPKHACYFFDLRTNLHKEHDTSNGMSQKIVLLRAI